jgi:hypothetical protein
MGRPSALRWAGIVCPVGAHTKTARCVFFSAPLRPLRETFLNFRSPATAGSPFVPLAFHLSPFVLLPRCCGVPSRPLRGLEAQGSQSAERSECFSHKAAKLTKSRTGRLLSQVWLESKDLGRPFRAGGVWMGRPSALRWAGIVCPVGAQYKGRLLRFLLRAFAPLRETSPNFRSPATAGSPFVPLAFHLSPFTFRLSSFCPAAAGFPSRPLRGLEAQGSPSPEPDAPLVGCPFGVHTDDIYRGVWFACRCTGNGAGVVRLLALHYHHRLYPIWCRCYCDR